MKLASISLLLLYMCNHSVRSQDMPTSSESKRKREGRNGRLQHSLLQELYEHLRVGRSSSRWSLKRCETHLLLLQPEHPQRRLRAPRLLVHIAAPAQPSLTDLAHRDRYLKVRDLGLHEHHRETLDLRLGRRVVDHVGCRHVLQEDRFC